MRGTGPELDGYRADIAVVVLDVGRRRATLAAGLPLFVVACPPATLSGTLVIAPFGAATEQDRDDGCNHAALPICAATSATH